MPKVPDMPDVTEERLAGLLRATPPDSVLRLPHSQRAALADLLDRSRRRQAETLQAAFTASLKHVPFPVRGIVKKILIG
jgi:hypothetical protein